MPLNQLRTTQIIPVSIEKAWDFISNPKNLKQITPPRMGFDIITKDLSEKMYPGMIIAYRVSPLLGLKLTWVTEITHVSEGEFFVDEQRLGPYFMWHHEHRIRSVDGGTEMTDLISYIPPFGILGAIANTLIIKRQLKKIFDYRFHALKRIFG